MGDGYGVESALSVGSFLASKDVSMRPNRLPVDDSELNELPELSSKLKELADSILEEGPASLIAFVKYFLERTQHDPQWMSWLQQASAELGLPDFNAAASPEDLDDGLIYKVKITLRAHNRPFTAKSKSRICRWEISTKSCKRRWAGPTAISIPSGSETII